MTQMIQNPQWVRMLVSEYLTDVALADEPPQYITDNAKAIPENAMHVTQPGYNWVASVQNVRYLMIS